MNHSSSPSREEILREVSRTLPLSQSSLDLLSLVQQGDDAVEYRGLKEAVESDPVLCGRILSIANSPRYYRGHEVDSIESALSRLGVQEVVRIGLEAVLQGIADDAATEFFGLENGLWEHALATAIAARELALRFEDSCVGAAYATGLLHGIGRIPMESSSDESMFNSEFFGLGESIDEAEAKQFGITCAGASSALLEHWNIPASISDPVKYQDHPDLAPPDVQGAASILHLARHVANCGGWGDSMEGTAFRVSEEALARYALTENEFEEVLAITMAEFDKRTANHD